MTTHRTRHRNRSGNALLAIVMIVAAGAILYFGYKLIKKLTDHPFDINHGLDTNVVDVASSDFAQFMAQYPGATITIVESGTTLPITALTQSWSYQVLTSSNLSDWEATTLDWAEAKDLARTNHVEPQRFWKLNLITE